MSPAKLTRTQSLLRSSPTIRSSIHSLSSVTEEDVIAASQGDDDEEKQKKKPVRSGSTPRTGSNRIAHHFVAMASLSVFTLFLFFFFYLGRREEISTSENLLLALVFVAVTLFLASKNKGLISHSVSIIKHSWDGNLAKRLCFSKSSNAKPVQWYIGDPNPGTPRRRETPPPIVREGVEFYSNGDFYEGEFHKGRCNGSGVYNYFANGRYEGDWVDGRYDGYGIEGWARGSRYKGQYRQGVRHGYGVYRFFTGDSYAGEWCNGQSHGVGVQTCSDGSCYVGGFKCGVKHGLGTYHFR